MVSAERTTRTTIRRVGLEGRPETPAGAAVGAGDMSPDEEPAQPVEPTAAAGGAREEVA
jgi:hypothetical protein